MAASSHVPEYEHTQHGRLHYVLIAAAAVELIIGWAVGQQVPIVFWICAAAAVICLLLAAAFAQLTIRDEGEHLALRYGPLPLVSKRFRYDQITAAAPSRTTWTDGWGIHYTPGRGWVYNLSGYDCVEIHYRQKPVRLGSDDVERLSAFLRGKDRANHL